MAIFWGAKGAPILFSEIDFCVASCSYIYVTGFAKRDHLGLRSNFELGIWSESTLVKLPVAFYSASLAATVFEIRWLKLRNYVSHNIKKMAFESLLPVKPTTLSVLHFRYSPYTKKMTMTMEVFGPCLWSRKVWGAVCPKKEVTMH